MDFAKDDYLFHTVQGEGKYMGHPSIFVRLSRCNLRCTWENTDGSLTKCDTPHTSFNPQIEKIEIKDIVTKIHEINCYHVVVTGGEPYFQKDLKDLISGIKTDHQYVTIETNGTIYRESNADYISISPKLKSSSMCPRFGEKHDKQRINYDSLQKFIENHNYQFKFVINEESEIQEIFEIKRILFERTGIDIHDNIWLMPQGINENQFKQKEKWLFDICKQYDLKYTDRLHIRVYGNIKGV